MCARVSIAVLKHRDQKQHGKEKVYFILQFSYHNTSLREFQDRSLEAGTEAVAMAVAAYCLVPHSLLRLLSYNTQDHLPGVAPSSMD